MHESLRVDVAKSRDDPFADIARGADALGRAAVLPYVITHRWLPPIRPLEHNGVQRILVVDDNLLLQSARVLYADNVGVCADEGQQRQLADGIAAARDTFHSNNATVLHGPEANLAESTRAEPEARQHGLDGHVVKQLVWQAWQHLRSCARASGAHGGSGGRRGSGRRGSGRRGSGSDSGARVIRNRVRRGATGRSLARGGQRRAQGAYFS